MSRDAVTKLDRNLEASDVDQRQWAAVWNLHQQERLLADLRTAAHNAGLGCEQIGKDLGVPAEFAEKALHGQVDLTLTELRLLALACNATVSFDVRSSTEHFRRLLVDFFRDYKPAVDEDPGHDTLSATQSAGAEFDILRNVYSRARDKGTA